MKNEHLIGNRTTKRMKTVDPRFMSTAGVRPLFSAIAATAILYVLILMVMS